MSDTINSKALNESWLDQPVFILSIGKTGTTLLLALLDGHGEILTIPEETDYFDAVHTPLQTILSTPFLSRKQRIDRIVELWCKKTHLRLLNGTKRESSFATGNLDYSKVDFKLFRDSIKEFISGNKLTVETVIKAVPYAYAKATKHSTTTRAWIEKTPYHKFNVLNKIPVLESVFPKARFIHLYRDPLDIYLSYAKKRPDLWTTEKFIFDFKRNVAITKTYDYSKNHFLLKYEDLVLHTKTALDRLISFLGVVYQESLLIPTKNGVPWEGNSVDNRKFSQISNASVSKHKKNVRPTEFALIEYFLADEYKYLGYDQLYQAYLPEDIPDMKSYDTKRKKKDFTRFQLYRAYNLVNNVF